MIRLMAVFIVLAIAVAPVLGQTTPFLSDDEIRMLENEISGDRSFEHIRALTQWHRASGSEGYFKAVDYVVQAAKDAGLEDVKFIEQPMMGKSYNARVGELWMVEPAEYKLADRGDHALFLADGSHDADVTAELVWIGDASRETVENLDVEGKIVLTSGSPGRAAYTAVWGKGAVGIVAFPTSEGKSPYDYPDQVAWNGVPMNPPEGKEGTFAFVVSPRMGETLRRILETKDEQDLFGTGKRAKGGKVLLHAKVDTDISEEPGTTGFVEGWIRGSKYKDQQIVVTAHLQEEQGSANDDGSGCGNILELARVFTKLINEGKIPRPLRDIRFWWTDEIYSEYRYFGDNPGETKKFLANLHQDMTGAKQTLGSRVQHLILAPHSMTSYLDAMFESVGTFVIYTNNAFLPAGRQGGMPRPHSRPIYAKRGTRDGYNARFVPFFSSSDHMCFLDANVSVPAVAMINWDDPYIHSSDDDLWQVDQTQLQRNDFIIGALAYILAYATKEDVPLIASEVYAQGSRRLASDLQVAMELVRTPAGGEADGWNDGSMVLRKGLERELRALESATVFTENDSRAGEVIKGLKEEMQKQGDEQQKSLRAFYVQLYGKYPPAREYTEAESAAKKKIPVNSTDLSTYFMSRWGVRADVNLHGLMREEVYRFADGKRSYFDIYESVRSEALTTGSWYYGTVSLEDVATLLDAAVEAKVMSLK